MSAIHLPFLDKRVISNLLREQAAQLQFAPELRHGGEFAFV